jgi:phenol 2-monooxygenase
MDFRPSTNLPDIRSVAYIHSAHGSLLCIPREGDLIRLYIQIEDGKELVDEDGRLKDKSLVTPEKLLSIAKKSLAPYKLEMMGEPEWWAAYISELGC